MAAHWTARDIPSQGGRNAIVTGANVGLGFHTARELARAGARVTMACRSVERGEAAAARIRAEQPQAQVAVEMLDVSSLVSVHAFSEKVISAGLPIHLLVNNAGVMALPQRETSADGFELQFATNYLGHYALTGLVLPLLLAAESPRVVSISSNAHKRGGMYFDDLQMERGYTPFKSYQQSKLCLLLFARELQRQADAHGAKLLSAAAHPGLAATSIGRVMTGPGKHVTALVFRLLGQSDAEGALPQLYAATAPDVTPGGYYGPRGFQEFKGSPAPAKVAPQGADAGSAARLWAESERLTGLRYAWPAR